MRRPSAPILVTLALVAASAILLIVTLNRGGGGGTTPAANTTTAASSTTATPTSSTDSSPTAAETVYGDGIYTVPNQMLPGQYEVTAGAGHACYWARLRSFGDGARSIIAQHNLPQGDRETVTVASDDAGFKVALGCRVVPVG